jgi:acyl carrier protein
MSEAIPRLNVFASPADQATIKEIVCEILELEEDEVTQTSLFKEEHGADSLRAIEILAALEREFDVVIDQEALPRMVNLEGVYAVVTEASGVARAA